MDQDEKLRRKKLRTENRREKYKHKMRIRKRRGWCR